MSFDIGINDNKMNDSPVIIGNDGSVIESERSSLSYSPYQQGWQSPTSKPQKGNILISFRDVLHPGFWSDNVEDVYKIERSVVINGMDVLSTTVTDVGNMSLDVASQFLNQLYIQGYLYKKGFRRLRLWKKRYFTLRGNVLLYFDKSDHKVPRRRCEITPDCKVIMENISGRPYAFSMVPCKGQCPYILDCCSSQDRDIWIHYFTLVQLLTKRLSSVLPSHPKQSIMEVISLQDTLGKGAYGVVRLGRYIKTGEMCAVKVINKKKVDRAVLECELAVIKKVKNFVHSDEVVQILDIFEDAYLVYIVMEYMGGGDLNSRLNAQLYFSETQAARIIQKIGKGLLDLHEQNIYHLDVKPENIIYESNDKASAMKITDFGCSLLVEHFNRDTNEIVGTAGYVAPEVISKYQYSEKADVYSLGVTLFILLMGYPPIRGHSTEELLYNTVHQRIEYIEEDWEEISSDALLLVKNMLAKNPEERLSMKEVLSFPWVNKPSRMVRKSTRMSISISDFSLPTTLPGSNLHI